MKNLLGQILFFFFSIVCLPALAQTESSVLDKGVLSDVPLGFRYTPPDKMFDETDSARESVRSRAAALHTTNVFDVLLSLGFGDDTGPEWFSVGVETFPRSKISITDASAAEARINVLAGGARATLVGSPRVMTVAGQAFSVSEFEQSEPPLLKHARVYTTIRGDRFVTFSFSANSAAKIEPIAESMRSLEFSGQTSSYLGFDRNDYPGDEALAELRKAFDYTGYWLNNPPGSASNTWAGKRGKVEAAGFGFLVLFNGRLYAELKSVDGAAKLGLSDARSAVSSARRDGFPGSTIIFLDQEQGGRMLPEQKAYIFAWVDEVVRSGFRAGVYCSGMAGTDKDRVVTAEDIHRNAGNRDITYWVTNDACPPAPGCVAPRRPPQANVSGISFAEVWQFAQSPRRKDVAITCSEYDADGNCYAPASGKARRLPIDLNSANSPDPSHGRRSDKTE